MSRNLADLAGAPTEPIPLSVLTGFLGSGKTTFLSRVLAVPDLRDTAVIISEFGAVALDHLLLEAAVDDVFELPNGCTCCAVRQWLADSFYRLLRSRQATVGRPPFRRIALETSGLADPGSTLYTLSADAFLEASLRFDRVVTTVDAVIGAETLDRYPEAAAQAAVADLLLITKTDFSPVPDELVQRLASLNTMAPMVDAGDADASTVLFGGLPKALPRPRLSAVVVHAHGIYALSVRLQQPMTRLSFAMALWAGWRAITARSCCGSRACRIRRPPWWTGGDPCRSAHALSTALAGALARCGLRQSSCLRRTRSRAGRDPPTVRRGRTPMHHPPAGAT